MKKALFAIIAITTIIFTAGCNDKSEKTLYEHGLEVVGMMDTLAESAEWQLTAPESIRERITDIGNRDYTEPSVVYELKLSEDILFMQAEISGASDEVKRVLIPRLPMTFISQINAAGGAELLATASMCTAGKNFVYSDFEDSTMYIYCFENGISAAVAFTKGEDTAVSASGTFILNNEAFPSGNTEAMVYVLKENFGENNYSLEIIKGE